MPQLPIYFDNHATTRVDPRVVDAMLPYFTEIYGNAASINHAFGWQALDVVDRARSQLASALNVDPRGVVFTSGATESNNLAIKGVLATELKRGHRPHVITTSTEHRSVLEPLRRLERSGVSVTVLPVDEFGRVTVQQVRDALQKETALVSVMWANNEIGSLNPIADVGHLCRERGILFHCDAVQAIGRIPVDFAASHCDLLSFSAHKFYGPKGIGGLIVRRGSKATRIEPLLDGGGHELHLRSGTLAVPLIVGCGLACELSVAELKLETPRLFQLRERLWNGLSSELTGLHLNGHPQERLPGNVNFSVEGVDGDALMNALVEIAVSSGSACTSADPEPSYVLRAIGRSDRLTRASLRFGLGRFTTSDEVDFAIDYVATQVRRLREATSSH